MQTPKNIQQELKELGIQLPEATDISDAYAVPGNYMLNVTDNIMEAISINEIEVALPTTSPYVAPHGYLDNLKVVIPAQMYVLNNKSKPSLWPQYAIAASLIMLLSIGYTQVVPKATEANLVNSITVTTVDDADKLLANVSEDDYANYELDITEELQAPLTSAAEYELQHIDDQQLIEYAESEAIETDINS